MRTPCKAITRRNGGTVVRIETCGNGGAGLVALVCQYPARVKPAKLRNMFPRTCIPYRAARRGDGFLSYFSRLIGTRWRDSRTANPYQGDDTAAPNVPTTVQCLATVSHHNQRG